MRMRERRRAEGENPPRPVGPAGEDSFREAGERLLAAGAEAIDRALSQDSAAFLAANRQQGGQ